MDDIDAPYGDVPTARHERFERASLAAVVAEAQMLAACDEVTIDQARQMFDNLADFGVVQMEPAEYREFTMQLTGDMTSPNVTTLAQGWRFATANGSTIFTVLPSSVSVQVTEYERWSTGLKPQFERVLKLAADVCLAQMVRRVGLRYLNRFEHKSGEEWSDLVHPSIAGVLSHHVIGGHVTTALQQFELHLEDLVGAVVRCGPMVAEDANQSGYVIDLDVFNGTTAAFEPAATMAVAQRLNRTAKALFSQLISDEQYERMGPVGLAGDEETT
jgi:uncharacterized protein (TIGR04255 family)